MIGVKDKPGIIAELFTILGAKNINVDMIVQTTGHDGKANIDFTILSQELVSAKEALKKYDDDFDKIEYDENIAKVSIVGLGMKSHTGVAGKGFLALSNENINILMVSTSEIKISIIVNEKYAELAVRSLHDVYKLDK
jgi:aspartate kinase